MTTEMDDFRSGLVAAVQAELERHASAVVAEVDRLREDGQRERAEMRNEFREQLSILASAIEQLPARSEAYTDRSRDVIEQRIAEVDARQTRRLDESHHGIEGIVTEAMRPTLASMKDEYDGITHKVEGLEGNLRRFDEQAARMVTYFNDVSSKMEARQDELSDTLRNEVTSQIDGLKQMVEDNDSSVRRFQNEMGQSVTGKINDAEDRFNNRLLAAESRVKEDAGQKIAEVQAHVGRVSTGLDDTMTVLNERVASLDDRFVETDRRIDGVAEAVQGVDQEALEELKDKMSSAAGEAMLVRIEMERMEKNVGEKTDTLAVRMTEVESQLQDATMDVSTAVQLDRLEEIERSLLELDPAQFVRRADAAGQSVKNDVEDADALNGVDASE